MPNQEQRRSVKDNMTFASKAMLNGIKGGNLLQRFRIYCVSRDLTITCNENNIGWWLKNANYKPTNIIITRKEKA